MKNKELTWMEKSTKKHFFGTSSYGQIMNRRVHSLEGTLVLTLVQRAAGTRMVPHKI